MSTEGVLVVFQDQDDILLGNPGIVVESGTDDGSDGSEIEHGSDFDSGYNWSPYSTESGGSEEPIFQGFMLDSPASSFSAIDEPILEEDFLDSLLGSPSFFDEWFDYSLFGLEEFYEIHVAEETTDVDEPFNFSLSDQPVDLTSFYSV